MTQAPELLTDFRNRIERDGYAVTTVGVPDPDLARLTSEIEALGATIDLGTRGGVRDAFRLLPGVLGLAVGAPMWRLATATLGESCAAVRAIIFDKTPDANWKVSWHQDLTIAVKRRIDVDGYGSWSEKNGIPHVQPPAAVLEKMVTLRLHLDPCGADNGPVRVMPGSHRDGRLAPDEIDRLRAEGSSIECIAERGEVLAMRPLLLHASSPSASPAHRRVVHIEYAVGELPGGLEWYEEWRPAAPELVAGRSS